MASKPDLGALEKMTPASEDKGGGYSPAADSKDGSGGVSSEEMMHAEDMGFDKQQAMALKRFIQSCMDRYEAKEDAEQPEPGGGEPMGGAEPPAGGM